MSDSGNDSTPQNPNGGNDQQTDTSKLYSTAYNNGLETAEKRVLKKFSELTGQNFENPDKVYDWVKSSSEKLSASISDPTATQEYKQLQQQAKEYQEKLSKAEQTATQIRNQYKVDTEVNKSLDGVKKASKLIVPENALKTLFFSEHDYDVETGRVIKKDTGTPVMDNEGNYKPLQSVLSDFSKPYIEPLVEGSGGGSGNGTTVKPKRSDFNKAVQDKRYDVVEKMYAQAKEAGGWEE
jgi:hypothetical protein